MIRPIAWLGLIVLYPLLILFGALSMPVPPIKAAIVRLRRAGGLS